jgi:hypothetical protein
LHVRGNKNATLNTFLAMADLPKNDDTEEFNNDAFEASGLDELRYTALHGGMRQVQAKFSRQEQKLARIFLTYNEPSRICVPYVIWLYGGADSKDHWAREILGPDHYVKRGGLKWWNGYDGHKKVLISDFKDTWKDSPIWWLSKLFHDPVRVECKGGSRQFLAETIVITSLFHPETLYRDTGEDVTQLTSKCDNIFFLGEKKQASANNKPAH